MKKILKSIGLICLWTILLVIMFRFTLMQSLYTVIAVWFVIRIGSKIAAAFLGFVGKGEDGIKNNAYLKEYKSERRNDYFMPLYYFGGGHNKFEGYSQGGHHGHDCGHQGGSDCDHH